MSIRAALQQYVQANPGQALRAIAAGIGIRDRAGITNAGAQLCQLAKKGKLRTTMPGGRIRGALYYPTATTGIDRRVRYTPEQAAQRQRDREQRKAERRRAARREKRLTPAQRDAFYRDLPPPAPVKRKPTAEQQFVIGQPRQRTAARATNAQTVDEFIAQGGQIERLAPHACSKPLRYDHSNNTVPTGKRRPALRVRGSHCT